MDTGGGIDRRALLRATQEKEKAASLFVAHKLLTKTWWLKAKPSEYQEIAALRKTFSEIELTDTQKADLEEGYRILSGNRARISATEKKVRGRMHWVLAGGLFAFLPASVAEGDDQNLKMVIFAYLAGQVLNAAIAATKQFHNSNAASAYFEWKLNEPGEVSETVSPSPAQTD